MVNPHLYTPQRVSPLSGHVLGHAQSVLTDQAQFVIRHNLNIIQMMCFEDNFHEVIPVIEKYYQLTIKTDHCYAATIGGILSHSSQYIDNGYETSGDDGSFWAQDERSILSRSFYDWLLVSSLPSTLIKRLRREIKNPSIALVDQSHGLSVFRLTGTHSRELLRFGTLMDVHERSFLTGTCVATRFFQLHVHIHAIHDQCFDLYVPRSFALHLWESVKQTIENSL